ncbi:hypothetical protein U1Q18_047279, partial [Sarracenia purpurea var. burkii]
MQIHSRPFSVPTLGGKRTRKPTPLHNRGYSRIKRSSSGRGTSIFDGSDKTGSTRSSPSHTQVLKLLEPPSVCCAYVLMRSTNVRRFGWVM